MGRIPDKKQNIVDAVPIMKPRRRKRADVEVGPLGRNERAIQALQLRIQGKSYVAIAAELGYASHSGARQAIERLRDRMQLEPIEDAIALQAARLDEAINGCMTWMREYPNQRLWAMDRLVPLLKRQAELLGLDSEPGTAQVQVLIREYGVPLEGV